MAPRKRTRVSRAASPTSTSQAKSPTPMESSPSKEDEQLLNDPWTDEEEVGLFKGLMRWKPTGIHKHFHLLSLHQFLLENGYIHPRNEHTKPAGIWLKLQTLYNLESLDEREDARQLDKLEIPKAWAGDEGDTEESSEGDDADAYSEAANRIQNEDFSLPGADFEGLKWAHRLADEKERRDESPPLLPELNMADEPPVRFTPSFSIEPSEAATPTGRRGRPRASTAATRAAAASTGTRRSTRHAESVADEAAEEQEEEAEDEDEEDEDDEEDEEEEDESEASTPAPRSTRSAAGTRGRPSKRPEARGRGRGR